MPVNERAEELYGHSSQYASQTQQINAEDTPNLFGCRWVDRYLNPHEDGELFQINVMGKWLYAYSIDFVFTH